MEISVIIGLLVLAGTALTVSGSLVGALITGRIQRMAAETAALAAKTTSENSLIDQLQEELKGYRETNDARSTEQDRRMQKLEENNIEITIERDILRDYAHQLRADILDGKAPPPAPWPDGVLR